ncbi:MAG: SIMPL domain-containing protein [Acidobacteria bacterium]|nr:SIMPL domain-containing protein [Acidobacteriota bacterium]
MARVAVSVLLMAVAAAPLRAQQPLTPPPVQQRTDDSVVVSTGEGVVRRAPDRAWVMLAAESRARTPQDAQRQNAEAMEAVTNRLKSAGVAADAIQTTMFDLQPEFDYANGKQTLRGYVARNQLQVRVDALPRLGEIIASAVGSGATNVSGVRFDLKDREAAEREALRLAVADARSRAEAAARGANMSVDRVVRIEEQREFVPPPRPMMTAMRADVADRAVAVPIEAGEIDIRIHVSMTSAIK